MLVVADGLERRVKERAHELGADLVGLAPATSVMDSPSHRVFAATGSTIDGDEAGMSPTGTRVGPRVDPKGKTIVVVALAHPRSKPELDYFSPRGNTPGNSILIGIVREFIRWLDVMEGVHAQSLHYTVERGGVFLKDAAVMAGLGCIGRNNLLVTSEFGPRVRLRGVLVDADLEPDTPSVFDPCSDCLEYCRDACPRGALIEEVRLPEIPDLVHRPARDGRYRRSLCMVQMNKDRSVVSMSDIGGSSVMEQGQMDSLSEYPVVHCRHCELACPVGTDR